MLLVPYGIESFVELLRRAVGAAVGAVGAAVGAIWNRKLCSDDP